VPARAPRNWSTSAAPRVRRIHGSQDEHDRHVRKMLLHPRQRLHAGVDISGQHDHIGSTPRRFEGAEFQVQIT